MRLARKFVDTGALVQNYRYLKTCCPQARVLAVVKSDAYGHGLVKTAQALSAAAPDGFAVAVPAEGVALRTAGVGGVIVVMQGALDRDDLCAAAAHDLALVIHSFEQLEQIERHGGEGLALWVKFDTGMHRLGFPPAAADEVIARIKQLRSLSQPPVLMSHSAYADELGMEDDDDAQWRLFERVCANERLAASMSNSGGVLSGRHSQLDWVRVGIALYGAPPVQIAAEHRRRLTPVMRVTAPLIAICECRAGDRVGYGGAYTCPRDMRIGVVGIGYGDGYPRHARDGTPVWLGGGLCELAGRVSMDMITVVLDDKRVAVNDVAELWGPRLPVAEVAAHCGTISYDLLCAAQGIEEEAR